MEASALMLVWRDEQGRAQVMPFTCRDGNMVDVVESIADYIVGSGLCESFWEAIAADRLGVILEQRAKLGELASVLRSMPVRELVG